MELIYARWLRWGTGIGLALLAAAFFAYAFGLAEPFIALDRLPQVWSLPLEQYLEATGAPKGWRSLRFAGKADYANLAGIAVLSLVTLGCYLRLLAELVRRGERALALIAAAQAAVLLVAASGWLSGAG